MARTKSIPKASTPTPPKAEDEAAGKKQRRWKAGTVALREIKRYQAGTNLLIGVAPVHRLIKEIDQEIHNGTRHRFKRSALQALHALNNQIWWPHCNNLRIGQLDNDSPTLLFCRLDSNDHRLVQLTAPCRCSVTAHPYMNRHH